MKKIIEWIWESHRIHHVSGGVAIGMGADDMYCAAYAGVGVAGALELKDYLWGGKPDYIDFLLTIAGVAVGYSIRILLTHKL